MDVLIVTLALSVVAPTDFQEIDNSTEALWELVHDLREEVQELKNQDNNDAWFNEQRAIETKNLADQILRDADLRSSLQGSGSTSGWPWLASTDGKFKLKFGGQIQARWLLNEATGQEDDQGFEQRRTKLKFSGHVGDPSWQYKVTATWGRNDGSSTEDAYINKKFDDGSWFKFGQYKAGFLRENIVSSSKQLGVERSMLNNAFTYGWTQGIEYGWRDDDMGFIFQYNDGPGLANSQALDPSRSAWIARVEYKSGDASWKDLGYLTSKVGAKDGFMLGLSYQSMEIDDAGTSAEYGNVDANKSEGWSVDASWRGDGWNVLAYMVDTTGTTTDGTEIDSSGWLVQGGYMINEHTEIFAKHQEGEIEGFNNDMSALSIGFNYWPIAGSNSVKWTTDVSWAGDSLSDDGDGISPDWVSSGNGWRADTGEADDQMLIRTQLQLLF